MFAPSVSLKIVLSLKFTRCFERVVLLVCVVLIWNHFSEFGLQLFSIVFGLMCPMDGGIVLFCCAVLRVVLCQIEQVIRSFVLIR